MRKTPRLINRLFIFLFPLIVNLPLAYANAAYLPRIAGQNRFSAKRNIRDHQILLPIYSNKEGDDLIFTNLGGKFDNLGSSEYNIAVGYRKLISDSIILDQKQWIRGFYISLDRLASKYNHVFLQTTIGVEFLSQDYDFRTNVYLPQNKEMVIDNLSFTPQLNNSKLSISYVKEKPLKGADIEFGYKIPSSMVQSKLFAGGYYFKGEGYPSLSGPRIRAEIAIDNNNLSLLPKAMDLTMGFEYQYDKVRKEQLYGIIKICYRFGSVDQNNYQLKNRMTDFIVRDVDIVTSKRKLFDDALHQKNSGEIKKVYVVHPSDNLASVVNNAEANSVIILDGGNGGFNLDSSIELKEGQELVGGSIDLVFKTKKFFQRNFLYHLDQPDSYINAVSNQNQDYLVKLGNGNLIKNLNFHIETKAKSESIFKKQINRVIYVKNVQNASIANVGLSATNNENDYKSYQKLSAIEIFNSRHIKISNDSSHSNNLVAGYGNAVLISKADDVTIDGLNFYNNHVGAIHIYGNDLDEKSSDIKISHSFFDTNKNSIIVDHHQQLAIDQQNHIVEGLMIGDSDIVNSEQKAIIINRAKNVSIDKINVSGIQSKSLDSSAIAINYSSNVELTNSKINAGTADGLLYSSGDLNFLIDNLSVLGVKQNAIHIKNFYGSVKINDTTAQFTDNFTRGLLVSHNGNFMQNQLSKPEISGYNNNFGSCKYIGSSKSTSYYNVNLTNDSGVNCGLK